MSQTFAYLLYVPENAGEAQMLSRDLGRALVHFVANPPVLELETALKNNPAAPVIVLVSDELLKSSTAMEYVGLLNQNAGGNWMPLLMENPRPRIANINEIMSYRDFWYEEWIRLRKQCNAAQGEELIQLEHQKNIAKKMSTQISSFIKTLKDADMTDWQQFQGNHYQVFFAKIGRGSSSIHERFVLAEEPNDQSQESPNQQKEEQPVAEVLEVVEEKLLDTPLPPPMQLERNINLPLNGNGHPELTESVEWQLNDNELSGFENELKDVSMENDFDNIPSELEQMKSEEKNAFFEEFDHRDLPPFVPTEKQEETTNFVDSIPHIEAFVDEQPLVSIQEEKTMEEKEFSMRSLEELDDLDEHDLLGKIVQEENDDIDVLFQLAQAETEESDFNTALHYYEKILSIDPFSGRALLASARILSRHFPERVAQADMLYRRAIAFNDESARLNYEYGLFLREHFKEHRKAAELMRQALDLDPYLDHAYYELALCQKELGQPENAKANYLQACVLNVGQYQSPDNDVCFGILRAPSVESSAVQQQLPATPIKNPNEDTVVLVTGATSGIGRAIAERFAMDGFRVIVTGRREHRLYEMRDYLKSRFDNIHLQPLCFDVRKPDALRNALLALPEEWQNVDILINNAGLAKGASPLHEGSLDHWEQMIDTNIKGLLYMTRTIVPGMVKRQKGHIINIGSLAAKEVYPNGNVYCATKAAVDTLTRSLRVELYKHNVRVSVVNPGMVEETEFSRVRYDDDMEKASIYDDFNALKAKDVADMVYFIANRPEYVDIQDVVMSGTQQGGTNFVHRNGRKF